MVSPGSSLVVRGHALGREQAGGVTTLHSRFHGWKKKDYDGSAFHSSQEQAGQTRISKIGKGKIHSIEFTNLPGSLGYSAMAQGWSSSPEPCSRWRRTRRCRWSEQSPSRRPARHQSPCWQWARRGRRRGRAGPGSCRSDARSCASTVRGTGPWKFQFQSTKAENKFLFEGPPQFIAVKIEINQLPRGHYRI